MPSQRLDGGTVRDPAGLLEGSIVEFTDKDDPRVLAMGGPPLGPADMHVSFDDEATFVVLFPTTCAALPDIDVSVGRGQLQVDIDESDEAVACPVDRVVYIELNTFREFDGVGVSFGS